MFFAYWSWDWIGAIFLSEHVSLAIAVVVVTFCIVMSIFSYTKIFLRLRQHQAQVQGMRNDINQAQPNGARIPLNIARYKKTVSSIAWVQLALVACYVPFVVVVILRSTDSEWRKTSDIAFSFVVTLVYLNSSLKPITLLLEDQRSETGSD